MKIFKELWGKFEKIFAFLFGWIKNYFKTLLKAVLFAMSCFVLICYIFELWKTNITLGVVNSLCAAFVIVEMVWGCIEENNKAQLGIFSSTILISIIMFGLNIKENFENPLKLELREVIADLSLPSWLWLILSFVSAYFVLVSVYKNKPNLWKDKNLNKKEDKFISTNKNEKVNLNKDTIEKNNKGHDPKAVPSENDKADKGNNNFDWPKLMYKMLPIFIAMIIAYRFLFDQATIETSGGINSFINVICVVLVIIEVFIGFWRTRNIEKICLLLPSALLSGILLYLNLSKNYNIFDEKSWLEKIAELPFAVWIWSILCCVASIACLLTLWKANVFSEEEIADIKKARNYVLLKSKKEELTKEYNGFLSDKASNWLALIITIIVIMGGFCWILFYFLYKNKISNGVPYQINNDSVAATGVIETLVYYFLFIIISTFAFYCIFCTVLDILKNVLPHVLGKKEEEGFNFLIEYEFPVSVLLVTFAFLFFVLNKGFDLNNITKSWSGFVIVILFILVTLVSIEVVRIVLKQCAERSSLLRLTIYLIFISLMKLLSEILIGVITNFRIRTILNSFFANLYLDAKDEIEHLIDKVLDLLFFNEIYKLIFRIKNDDLNKKMLWRKK